MIRNIRAPEGGFTIIEVIIVLAVSVALTSSALLLFRGRIPKTQFQSSVNELNVKLADISNQVSTGYYPRQQEFGCTSGGTISTAPSNVREQGESETCIFLGQAVQFGMNPGTAGNCTPSGGDNCDVIKIHTVYGRRTKSDGTIAKQLSEATPKIASADIASETYTLGYGLHVLKVISGGNSVGGVAYLQSFGSRIDTNDNPVGASSVDVVPLTNITIGLADLDFINQLDSLGVGGLLSTPNPSGGITVCLQSGTTDQYAILNLARGGVTTNTDPQILTPVEYAGSECA